MSETYDINSIQSLSFREGVRTRIHKTCEQCKHCHIEYCLGDYPTPICEIHGYLEELNNPYHNLNAEKCNNFIE